jgi:hypothetical protein
MMQSHIVFLKFVKEETKHVECHGVLRQGKVCLDGWDLQHKGCYELCQEQALRESQDVVPELLAIVSVAEGPDGSLCQQQNENKPL